MQLIGHPSLNLILHDRVANILENGRELVVSAHYTIIRLVQEEGACVDIFFDENQASLAIITLSQPIFLSFDQKFSYVIIGEVA